MSRNWSLLVLLGTVVGIGVLFFRVVWPFLFPLLLASILSILFRPVYDWVCRICYGRRRLAAALTTVGVVLIVMLPLSGVLVLSGAELVDAGKEIVRSFDLPKNAPDAKRFIDPQQNPQLASWLDEIEKRLPLDDRKEVRKLFSDALLSTSQNLYERTRNLAADIIGLAVGVVVVILGLYYLLADGEKLGQEALRLSPLQDEDGLALFEQFGNVCRGVVLSSILAAIVQGALGGLGFAIVGVERIWLLAMLTMFFSLIPFLGAAVVWICVVAFLLLQQRYGAATFLAIYGTVVVSGSDNLIKAYVIGDRAKLHPFVVLVTVLGALKLVGLWGIFIGPMTAAFFYALLNILRQRLLEDGDASTLANATMSEQPRE